MRNLNRGVLGGYGNRSETLNGENSGLTDWVNASLAGCVKIDLAKKRKKVLVERSVYLKIPPQAWP
jgi:hypothetical protein